MLSLYPYTLPLVFLVPNHSNSELALLLTLFSRCSRSYGIPIPNLRLNRFCVFPLTLFHYWAFSLLDLSFHYESKSKLVCWRMRFLLEQRQIVSAETILCHLTSNGYAMHRYVKEFRWDQLNLVQGRKTTYRTCRLICKNNKCLLY